MWTLMPLSILMAAAMATEPLVVEPRAAAAEPPVIREPAAAIPAVKRAAATT